MAIFKIFGPAVFEAIEVKGCLIKNNSYMTSFFLVVYLKTKTKPSPLFLLEIFIIVPIVLHSSEKRGFYNQMTIYVNVKVI